MSKPKSAAPFRRPLWCLALGALVHFAGVSLPTSAIGQPPATESATVGGSSYTELIEQAVAEFRTGNWPEAHSLFEAAHELQPSARTLRGIGVTAFEERSYVVAVQILEQALSDPRKPLSESQKTDVRALLARANRYVARYRLDVTPADAELLVDSRPAEIRDGVLWLNPGVHELEVSAPGHDRAARRVRAQPREELVLRIELTPHAASTPTAAVDPLPAQGPASRALRWTGGVVIALSGACFGTSLGLALSARSKRDIADCETVDGQSVCDSTEDKKTYDRAVAMARGATGMAVAGTATAVAGVMLLVWPDRWRRSRESSRKASAWVTPLLSRNSKGLSIEGSW